MSNRLQHETSPYLLQHKDNPVDWYPWCEEAFRQARAQDKPIFLSIGYSTCHWCHVLAHESFEDEEIAALLNRHFISIKVDKEERPDIDSVYMAVCQAFTGSGGWPTSIFMTAEQKPFFAGTYFPKTSRNGMIGMRELLMAIHEKWEHDRKALLEASNEVLAHLKSTASVLDSADMGLAHSAADLYKRSYDERYGGFGRAPKFPTPHNLLFLLGYHRRCKDAACLQMVEHTLTQMYRGGLFDHIGFGFCRYSTDKKYFVPHFEKMLYDNALLMLAYCEAFSATQRALYLEIAEKTAAYILREMTSPAGGFYSAQDADSEGEEGKYYLFTPREITQVLGEADAEAFNRRYAIREEGNFEGKNIPHLLHSDPEDRSLESILPALLSYRKKRYSLHLDDKILTAWNSLMIAAMCRLYLATDNERYLQAAMRADKFIQKNLCQGDTLFVSFRDGRHGVAGFLDDYAAYSVAQLALYRATLDRGYLKRAEQLCEKAMADFGDKTGGFFLYGFDSETLIIRPKETYDGAIPSGNSLMAYTLVRLSLITGDEKYRHAAQRQLDFLAAEASRYPAGYGMFLTALLEYWEPPTKMTVVLNGGADCKAIAFAASPDAAITVLPHPTEEYPLKNGKTTYYVCEGHRCLPPVNALQEAMHAEPKKGVIP